MIITEDIRKCVINRAAEIAGKQMVCYGEVNITKAVEQATADVKTALDHYLSIMRTMSVKMLDKELAYKTLSYLPTEEVTSE